jgi:Zn-dependent peptidase ImmA (M78 family)/transcriptional regulator with XRE-family HTH domain
VTVDSARAVSPDLTRLIGARVRRARVAAGLSQGDLARALDLSQAAISNIESGARPLRVDELVVVSRAIGRDVAYFLEPARTPTGPIGVTLRAQVADLPLPEYRAAVDAFLDEVERQPLPAPEVAVPAGGDAVEQAVEVRRATGQTGIPIEVDAAARMLGVAVVPFPFPDSLSALVLRHGDGAIIGVNVMHHPNRRRFSIAHELGHVVLHHDAQHFIEFGVPHADQGNPPGYDWMQEKAANDFAAEFLMPAADVRRDAAAISINRLARRYRVSESAMGFRLVNLGLQGR